MATFLDFSILSGARAIFAFLLIFVLIYGLLKFTKLFNFGDGAAALVAACMAILSVLSPSMVKVIEVVTPWYVLMMIIIIFILLITAIFGSLGGSVGDIRGNMGNKYKIVMTWIVVISFIIFALGLGYVFLSGEDSEYSLNVGQADQNASYTERGEAIGGKGVNTFLDSIFHPKVIGMILFLLIAAMTVLLMGYDSK